jgi:uncharacterized protein with ACT and thioredoxin-like domain
MTSDQITAVIALVVALTALAGAVTNYLNHLSHSKEIAVVNAKVDGVIANPAPIVVTLPQPLAPVQPLTGLPDGHASPARPGDPS